MNECSFCGKAGIERTFDIAGVTKRIIVFDCSCIDKEDERKRIESEQESLDKSLNKRLNNSLISKRFMKVSFETIEESEHYDSCLDYANKFNKETEQGFIMHGNIGAGKTTLATAICRRLMERKYKAILITMSNLLDRFNECYNDQSMSKQKILDWLLSYDFIVIDDMGKETYTEARKANAFDVFNELYKQCKPVCVTGTNKSLSSLKNIQEFEDVFDRLHQTCTQLEFKEKSRRRA